MTTAAEIVPATPKMRLILGFVAVALMFPFGLYAGTALFSISASVFSVAAALLMFLSLALAVLDLTRSLPVQNAVTAAALIVLISGVIELLILVYEYAPRQDVVYDAVQLPSFFFFRWRVPLILAVNLLNSRSVARLILRPWSNGKNIGLLSLGLTVLFAAFSNLGFENFYGLESLGSFIGYAAIATLVLLAITPWLIIKKPGPSPAPGFTPLLVWLMLLGILFAKWIA